MTPAEKTSLVPQQASLHLFSGGGKGPRDRVSETPVCPLGTRTQNVHMVTSVILLAKAHHRPAPTQEVEISTLMPQTVKGVDTGKSGGTEATVQSVYGNKIRM